MHQILARKLRPALRQGNPAVRRSQLEELDREKRQIYMVSGVVAVAIAYAYYRHRKKKNATPPIAPPLPPPTQP